MEEQNSDPSSSPMVFAVGETVFDIIFKDFHPQAAKPGGSAFNAMISLGRLGIPGSFISEVGNDRIGNYIKSFLRDNGVDDRFVVQFNDGKSALSLAFLDESSDASYDFYKDYPNQRLNEKMPVFGENDYLLFGSFYGLNPVLRPQVTGLLSAAEQAGAAIYYDPNFRSSHLADLDRLRAIIEENITASTLVRASSEDMENIYGVKTPESAYERVAPMCDYYIHTANAAGVDLFTPTFRLHVDVEQIQPVSTIGAGDTFNAGILYGLYTRGINPRNIREVSREEWSRILDKAGEFSRAVCLSYDNYISVRKS